MGWVYHWYDRLPSFIYWTLYQNSASVFVDSKAELWTPVPSPIIAVLVVLRVAFSPHFGSLATEVGRLRSAYRAVWIHHQPSRGLWTDPCVCHRIEIALDCMGQVDILPWSRQPNHRCRDASRSCHRSDKCRLVYVHQWASLNTAFSRASRM